MAKELTVGTVFVPVRETVYCEYEWDLTQADLDKYECKDLREFTLKVRSGEIRIWDLDYTTVETQDTEIEDDFPDEATAQCHVTKNTYPTKEDYK